MIKKQNKTKTKLKVWAISPDGDANWENPGENEAVNIWQI